MPLTGEDKRRYMAEYRARRYCDRIALAFELLGCRCSRCGHDHPAELEFHHRDPEDKEFGISSGWSVSLERFVEEVRKCVVLCIECHVEVDPQRFALAQELNR